MIRAAAAGDPVGSGAARRRRRRIGGPAVRCAWCTAWVELSVAVRDGTAHLHPSCVEDIAATAAAEYDEYMQTTCQGCGVRLPLVDAVDYAGGDRCKACAAAAVLADETAAWSRAERRRFKVDALHTQE